MKYITKHLNRIFYRGLVLSARHPEFYGNDFSVYPDRLKEEGYFSQYGQDKWISEKLLPGFKKGFFCDIGAHDGKTLSNTYYFEKAMGWCGLAFEPVPEIFNQLKKNRDCITVNGCVAPESGRSRFQVLSGYTEMLSGLVDHYHPEHLERINNELRLHGGVSRIIEVDAYRLNDVLDEQGVTHVDFMNIDVEGAEYSILKSIDFDRFEFVVVGIENNYQDFRIPLFMKRMGYSLNAIVGDEIYVKKGLFDF